MPRIPRRMSLALLPAALLLAGTASAGLQSTGEPQALPEPAMSRPAEGRFVLAGVRFSGATVFDDASLQRLAADKVGTEVDLGDLEAIAERVTAAYRARGNFLSRAFVPVQQVQAGVVEIVVTEGRLGSVRVTVADDAPVSATRIERLLGGLESDAPLDGRAYERGMLLVSDLPGVRAQSVVQPGQAPDRTDLEVDVTAGARWSATVELDNHGTRESGRHRVGASVRWASPLGIGDNLDLRVLAAEDANTVFGRLAYEAPVGYSGTRIGAGVARVQYELGGAVAALEPTGTSNIIDVAVTHPVIRQRGTNLLVRAAVDRKRLNDRLDAVDFSADKRIQGVGVGWAFEHRDRFAGGGYTSVNGVLYRGQLDILDPASLLLDQSPFGRDTHGKFTKLSVQVSRLQAIGGPLSLFMGLGFQETSRNLDPSEQLSLGGPRAVRAFPNGELLVDNGFVSNNELRWAVRDDLTVFHFFDLARGRPTADPGPLQDRSTRSLRGHGLGLSWSGPWGVTSNITLAWQDSGRSVADDRDPRLFWQLQKRF